MKFELRESASQAENCQTENWMILRRDMFNKENHSESKNNAAKIIDISINWLN
jgi:hypothetical protein